MLFCQPTHHAVSLTGEPHNGVACLLDLLVELSCEGFVFLTADKIALEVFISTGFQAAVLINDFFLKRNFCLDFLNLTVFPSHIINPLQRICHVHSGINMSLNNSENGVIYNRFFDAVRRAGGLVTLIATADEIGIFLFSAA